MLVAPRAMVTMGLRIFLHAVRLVFNQVNGALRISAALYIVSAVISGFGYMSAFGGTTAPGAMPNYSWAFFLTAVISGFLYLWIAVAWHRYVLLDEMPSSPVPPFHSDRVLAYLGRMLQIGLIVLAIAIVVGFINGMLAMATGGNFVILMLGTVVILTVALLISYRLAPVFPGAAVGRPVGVGEAWRATAGASGDFIVLAVVSAIASVVVDLPAYVFGQSSVGIILSLVWLSITAWVKLMVGVSILTAIYGVYVEKRSIA